MFSVRSNYMVWKKVRAHFCLDNGLELAWSGATLVWDGLIRVHFGLGRSEQRQFSAHSSLIRGRFERTLVWPETKSSEFFFKLFFRFLNWHLLSLLRVNNKAAVWSRLHLKIWWFWSKPKLPADASPLKKRFQTKVDQDADVSMQSCLSSFIQLKTPINDILNNFFEHFYWFFFISNIFRNGFSLVEYKIDNINFHEMNIL